MSCKIGVDGQQRGRRAMAAGKWVWQAITMAAALAAGMPAWAQAPGKIHLQQVIAVPGVTSADTFYYDGSIVDEGRRLYYLSDRTTKGIDIVDIAANKVVAQMKDIFVGQMFKGAKLNNDVSGPNGLSLVTANELWVGDGDSTIKIIDIVGRSLLATIATGGKARTDLSVLDPDHHVVMATNKNDAPPFVSFIDPQSRQVVGKLEFQAESLDGAVYDHDHGRYLLSVGASADNPQGEIDAVDPVRRVIVARYPTPECFPAGLALGPSGHLLIGCSGDAIEAGFKAKTLVMDAGSGKLLQTIGEVGGADFVDYDAGNKRFYLGARDMTEDGTRTTKKTPVLGVIDAVMMTFLENVPGAPNCKTVSADPVTNHVFMPLSTSGSGPGIGVFGD